LLKQVGSDAEQFDKFALAQFKTVQSAADAVIDFLGMGPCEGTGSVPSKARQHVLLLSGLFVGGVRVLARILLALDAKQGTTLKVYFDCPVC
jgi:coatomer protein complex subunit gamma